MKASDAENLGFVFSDFGTRRRFSYEWQDKIIQILKSELSAEF
ncbi:MAG: nicotinate phosphoribosyltransferase, partial [Desulfobacteraceae bacterium]|nr:nicotinate phosphoribosyltransferase [Desulfobacteraceae bacterium]